MAPGRQRKFSTVPSVPVDVADVPAAPPVVPAAPPAVSDIPSLEARNTGQTDTNVTDDEGYEEPDGQDDEMDFSLTGLLSGRPDPELDLVTRSYAIPRYMTEALRLENVRTRTPIQAIVANALRAHLPARLLNAARTKAERR